MTILLATPRKTGLARQRPSQRSTTMSRMLSQPTTSMPLAALATPCRSTTRRPATSKCSICRTTTTTVSSSTPSGLCAPPTAPTTSRWARSSLPAPTSTSRTPPSEQAAACITTKTTSTTSTTPARMPAAPTVRSSCVPLRPTSRHGPKTVSGVSTDPTTDSPTPTAVTRRSSRTMAPTTW